MRAEHFQVSGGKKQLPHNVCHSAACEPGSLELRPNFPLWPLASPSDASASLETLVCLSAEDSHGHAAALMLSRNRGLGHSLRGSDHSQDPFL